MTGHAHAAAGGFFGALAGKAFGDPLAGAVIGALAGLLPDIDHPGSTVGRKAPLIAAVLSGLFGHRTVTHTVWFCLVASLGLAFAGALLGVYAVTYVSWPGLPVLFAASLAGGLSHLALDACTRSGVEPFAPLVLPGSLARLNHIAGPLKTGDPLTELPAALFFVLGALRIGGVL
ncbi:inner membrane protein [Thermodesulfitimonas autotrophica]|uniref:Inner membrane protein n=1 Tax=Thermodesulfitimonas autotrophica TaxID=1894989 RepID=A0A3N5ABP1_9THEO|nr:metal-dependent hydrolase [Thermodesulfitimonas autotrophica]RPF42004.1 inner membrane protein [Thermodesulfitimonas autotrophica]